MDIGHGGTDSYAERLLAELQDAREELSRLRLGRPDTHGPAARDDRLARAAGGWHALVSFRRSLWFALSDSE